MFQTLRMSVSVQVMSRFLIALTFLALPDFAVSQNAPDVLYNVSLWSNNNGLGDPEVLSPVSWNEQRTNVCCTGSESASAEQSPKWRSYRQLI